MQIIEKNQLNNLNENTLKLKSEELLFKLKVKFGTLLQEVNITEAELNKFNKIHKVDEIILFLSEKIKDKLNQFTHIRNESNITSNKDR
jgi:DNA-binding Xre family transcriptional regulator